jgi:ABC-type transporter Mla MlaB component
MPRVGMNVLMIFIMDLEITNYNNRFEIKGTLNKRSLKTFKRHFATIFDKFDEILLDIEHIEKVDRYGVMALADLHKESIVKTKSLSIIGYGCNELFEYFKAEEPEEIPQDCTISGNEIVAA